MQPWLKNNLQETQREFKCFGAEGGGFGLLGDLGIWALLGARVGAAVRALFFNGTCFCAVADPRSGLLFLRPHLEALIEYTMLGYENYTSEDLKQNVSNKTLFALRPSEPSTREP